MKYDDASWHYGADNFPTESPDEYGGVHIALFMKWCFQQGWAGDMHKLGASNAVEKVISDKMSATEFFFKYCDGKLTDEDFNYEGNKFAEAYYGDRGLYLGDFAHMFEDLFYLQPESEFDYSLFSKTLADRYSSGGWKKPFWKIW